jgi:formate/nitrite transporter
MSNNALEPAPSSIDPLVPAEIARRIEAANVQRAHLPTGTLILLGLIGGLYIGLGGALATLALTDDSLGFGLSRLTAGLAFSLGLVMLVLAGGELFTGNNLMAMAYVSGKVPVRAVLRNWTLAYGANAAGAVLLAAAIYCSGALETGGVGVTAVRIAEMKAQLGMGPAFLRGVLCNALVCLAIWLSTAARSLEGKVTAIVFPISAFVALGFEHCIANLYLIPVAMLAGASVSLAELAGNIIPVTAGNTVGGVGVALAYRFVYLRDDCSHRLQLSPSVERPTCSLGAQFVRAAGVLLLAVLLLGGSVLPSPSHKAPAAPHPASGSAADPPWPVWPSITDF